MTAVNQAPGGRRPADGLDTHERRLRELLIERYSNLERLSRRQKLRFYGKRLSWSLVVKGAYLLKRVFDIVASLILMVLLLPVFLATALAIRLESPGPILFKQTRVGRWGELFTMWKFRSMYVDAEARKKELMAQNEMAGGVIFKMKDDPRVTRVGKLIRKTSIDELPQLWNVLIGEMSLVGPQAAGARGGGPVLAVRPPPAGGDPGNHLHLAGLRALGDPVRPAGGARCAVHRVPVLLDRHQDPAQDRAGPAVRDGGVLMAVPRRIRSRPGGRRGLGHFADAGPARAGRSR
jgi:lipopolysaccharide/colanic/teichoic acid biosynthesis glycosyltransferase